MSMRECHDLKAELAEGSAMKWSKEDQAYLRSLIKVYLKSVPDAMPEEKAELEAWVMSRHGPYDNPYYVWGENGFPLDFFSAARFWGNFEPPEKDNENPVPDEEDIDPFWDGVGPFAKEPPQQKGFGFVHDEDNRSGTKEGYPIPPTLSLRL